MSKRPVALADVERLPAPWVGVEVNIVFEEEEIKLRLKISPEHLPELDLALHTGLRRNEPFRLSWTNVNLRVGLLTVTKSKNGKPRHLPLNSKACSALEQLAAQRSDSDYVIAGPPAPRGRDWRRWFEDAVEAAKIPNLHFHDLRLSQADL